MARTYLTNVKPSWNTTEARFEFDGYEVQADLTHELCPAAAWPMSQEMGTVAHDIVGAANLTLGASSNWTADGININGTPAINTTISAQTAASAFSVFAIATPGGTGSSISLLGSRSTNNYGWACKWNQWNNSGKLGFTLLNVSDYTSNISTPSAKSFVGFTKSGNQLTIYHDATYQNITVGNMVTPSLPGIVIGGHYRQNAFVDVFPGVVNSGFFYVLALTAAQIASLNANPWQWLYYEKTDSVVMPAHQIINGASFGGCIL